MTKICSTIQPQIIDTQPLKALLARISDAALALDVKSQPDQASKLSGLMINLTKTIRETELYNQKIVENTAPHSSGPTGTLEERLKGYAPTPSELTKLRAELKERLIVLGPRLFEDEGERSIVTDAP